VKARCEVKLAAVRLTLRKLKNLPTWSETKEDDMVIQKIARYVVELGQCIGEQCMAGKGASGLYKGFVDSDVGAYRKLGDDGLGDVAAEDWAPMLWEYSAGFTSLEPAHLATMYIDIVKHCEKCDREQRDTELKKQKRERQRQEDERKRGRDSWSRDVGGWRLCSLRY
jgi:hypothetical protein